MTVKRQKMNHSKINSSSKEVQKETKSLEILISFLILKLYPVNHYLSINKDLLSKGSDSHTSAIKQTMKQIITTAADK